MLVRPEYSQEAVWRSALGGSVPLFCFALHGESLDAPTRIPSGSTRASTIKGRETPQTIDRDFLE